MSVSLFSNFDQLNVYYDDLLTVSKLNINITNITAIMNWECTGLYRVHFIERTIEKTALPYSNENTKAAATAFIFWSK